MPDTGAADPKQLLALSLILFVADLAKTTQYTRRRLVSPRSMRQAISPFMPPPVTALRSTSVISIYRRTVADVDRLYSELVGRGAKVIYGPVKQEYGMKEFYVEDCNGYRLAFGQQI